MFYLHITQRTTEPRSTQGWLNRAAELCEEQYRETFTLEEIAAILPTLEYEGCELIDATIYIA